MATLKEEWAQTGKEVVSALESLGKSLVRSAKAGIEKLDEWANSDVNKESSENADKE